MSSVIVKNNCQDLFPYVEIALRICLSCPVSYCSTVLTIDSDLTKKLDYDHITDTFADEKSRRKQFQL